MHPINTVESFDGTYVQYGSDHDTFLKHFQQISYGYENVLYWYN